MESTSADSASRRASTNHSSRLALDDEMLKEGGDYVSDVG